MRLDHDEIEQIADALIGPLADALERRLSESPEWARSIAEIAAFCDIPERTVRDAIESGRLPCIKIGRQIRVRRSDLFLVKGSD